MSNNSKVTKETIGLWRYGIIFPLLKKNFKPGEKAAIVKDISSKEYDIPGTIRTKIGKTTVYDWLNHYLEVGSVEGLYPKHRIDSGESRKINTEDQLALINFRQREDNKAIPITTLVEKAQSERVLDPNSPIKMNTVYRLMKNNNLENLSEESQTDRRRFEASAPNEIWQMDFMHAVNVKVEEKGKTIIKKAKIGVLIDDYSRLAMAKAYVYETDESLMDLMWDSFLQRGLPKTIYTDNGSAMKSQRISLGCTALQIILKFAKPYSPKGKAKVERFNKTLRDKYLATLTLETLTLREFNMKLKDFLYKYNCMTVHSSIGMTPNERFSSALIIPRFAPPLMPELFRCKCERKVSEARTIKINNMLYEVPVGYSKKKLELRYFYIDSDIEAFYNGKSLGFIHPVNMHKNVLAHRKQIKKEIN